jgi:predicted HicB family RNase H-like nuclease
MKLTLRNDFHNSETQVIPHPQCSPNAHRAIRKDIEMRTKELNQMNRQTEKGYVHFDVRIPRPLHRRLAIAAAREATNMRALVIEAIEAAVKDFE